LFFNPLLAYRVMRRVFVNLGPMVSFRHARVANYEGAIEVAGKGIVVEGGVIVKITDSESLREEYSMPNEIRSVVGDTVCFDLQQSPVVPGLIDTHTHLLWAGDRSQEISWRREGKSYADIASLGGGIQHTVEQTRLASDDQLHALGYQRLREALNTGTTHLEAKSGYGLSVESELRLLKVAEQLNGVGHTPSIDHTWMGAHDVPKGQNAEAYVESVISEQLPAVVEQNIARSADVFCEPGWFSVEQSESILQASRQAGLDLRMHVDEFVDGGGGDLASELRVQTADHAYHTSLESRLNMKEGGVNTGFLPGTPYAMGDAWPNMDEIVEHAIPFTLASDFNPNCRTLSLPFMCSLMVQRCGMHPLQALAAVSVNAAKTTPHPSGLPHGIIAEGAAANFNIIDGHHWESMVLRPSSSPFSATVLNGDFIAH
jgi:imidazolonepropionase